MASTIPGVQKSAVFMAAIPQDQAVSILRLLPADDAELIMGEMAQITTAPDSVVEAVLSEFTQVAMAVDSFATGGLDRARLLLEEAMGATAAQSILARIASSVSDSGMRRLKRASPEVLLGILRGEAPQTIALILTHLDPVNAAGVIEIMDPHLSSDILGRIGTMERVAPEMLPVIEAGLANKADLSLNSESSVSGGPDVVAQILTRTTPSVEKLHMEALARSNPALATEIASRMFTFEDLKLLDRRSMEVLFRQVDDQNVWALAMKGISTELRDTILSHYTDRQAENLLDMIEALGRVPVREVEQAQSQITSAVRALEQAGDLVVPGRGKSDGFVE